MRVPRGLAAGPGLARAACRSRRPGFVPKVGSWSSGPRELAMSVDEAEALLAGAGVEAPANWIDDLLQRTEGWPVGLYLAALAMRGRHAHRGRRLRRRRPVGRATTSAPSCCPASRPTRRTFCMRTSVLDRLCGPLCDAVADVTGAARMLEDLAGHNMLVLPLDRHREWYRYHHLLRDHLQAELRLEHRRDPRAALPGGGLVRGQRHARSRAIEHAQAAGDADRVADTHPGAHESRLGERTRRHGPALDAVARGPSVRPALCGRDGPRRSDLRAARASRRGGAVGRGG